MSARAVLLLTLSLSAAASACRHGPDAGASARAPDDATLADLEAGFAALRAGDNARARQCLARAVSSFDDLTLDGSDLERAFASDPTKPYRGRPHERTLAALTLAALDIEAGRCDLAQSALRNARYLDARSSRDEAHDVPLIDELERVCSGAAGPLVLAFTGHGPRFTAGGAHGEALVVTAGGGAEPAGRIAVGAAPTTSSAPSPAAPSPAWASSFQATHVGARRFDDVLASRARFKGQTNAEGMRLLQESQRRVTEGAVGGERQTLAGAALAAGAGVMLLGLGGVTDARVDTRSVSSLPEHILVSRTSP